jgi:hypothetical protein
LSTLFTEVIENNTSKSVSVGNVAVGTEYKLTLPVPEKGPISFPEVYDADGGQVVCTYLGSMPKTFLSNDCDMDEDFNDLNFVARPVVDLGSFIVRVFKSPRGRMAVAFKVLSRRRNKDGTCTFIFNCVYVSVLSGKALPVLLVSAVKHVIAVVDNCVNGNSFPRSYSLNDKRMYFSGLFVKEGTTLVSEHNDTKFLVFKGSTLCDDVEKVGFFRVYYSKRLKGNDTIIVDGRELAMLKKSDLEDPKVKQHLRAHYANYNLVHAKTKLGLDFIGLSTTTGVSPLYHSMKGISSLYPDKYSKEYVRVVSELGSVGKITLSGT